MKLNEILPGLYTRGQSSKLPMAEKLDDLEEAGVTQVINLWSRVDPDLEKHFGRGAYLHFAIPDAPLKPSQQQILEVLAARAARTIRDGGGVLVQCHAGRNRAGLMAALIVRELKGVNGMEAAQMVREARPNAIANPAFIAWLQELE